MKCPHEPCTVDVQVRDGVIATHDWPIGCRAVCPGSGEQAPWGPEAASDLRARTPRDVRRLCSRQRHADRWKGGFCTGCGVAHHEDAGG